MCVFMKVSPQRHNLAKLRLVLGKTQKEMAEIAGCSWPTIQAIELGKLKLSDQLGTRIAFKTGVVASWLLENDLNKEPTTLDGRPYTVSEFEAVLAQTEAFQLDDVWQIFGTNVRLLAFLISGALREQTFILWGYKSSHAIRDLIKAFVKSPQEAEKIIKAARVVETGPACVDAVMKSVRQFFEDTKQAPLSKPKGLKKPKSLDQQKQKK